MKIAQVSSQKPLVLCDELDVPEMCKSRKFQIETLFKTKMNVFELVPKCEIGKNRKHTNVVDSLGFYLLW